MKEPLFIRRMPFPDKPMRMYPHNLAELDAEGKYVGQDKGDGWRVMIIKKARNEPLTLLSRVHKKFDYMSPEVVEALNMLPIPPYSILDGEWMKRRTRYKGPEMVTLHGAIAWDGIFLKKYGEERRIEVVNQFDLPDDWLHAPVRKVKMVFSGFEEFFEETKNHPETEGMVLKRLDAPLILSLRDNENNPAWIKVKWRDGADGQTITA